MESPDYSWFGVPSTAQAAHTHTMLPRTGVGSNLQQMVIDAFGRLDTPVA